MNLSHKNIYITGDTCYHRRNIVDGISEWRDGTRPFKTHKEHDDALVSSINSCVKKDDTLICLGNFSFGGAYYVHEFFDRIECKDIYLVLGEFDSPKLTREALFTYVEYELTFVYRGNLISCTHSPMLHWKGRGGRNGLHFHGSLRSVGDDRFINGRSMDVGIDGNPNFTPYLLRDVVQEVKKIKPSYFNELSFTRYANKDAEEIEDILSMFGQE